MVRITKTITAIAIATMLGGCSTVSLVKDPAPPVVIEKFADDLAPPKDGVIVVAVYEFKDKTGQRKPADNIAQLSSAVTQGADSYLIRSLQTVGNGRWFKVVERGGLNNLVKERQLIRQMRELYEGERASQLPPMIFAGIIFEGGIIGYDSNITSGGVGARMLGIGASTQYRVDEVTVSLRAVSVATGEVLTTVSVTKSVASYKDRLDMFRFVDLGTEAQEAELGTATNEPVNQAIRKAVHGAVVETIKQGAEKGHWEFLTDTPAVVEQEPAQSVTEEGENPKPES